LLVVLTAVGSVAMGNPNPWEFVTVENGVRVTTRDVVGRSFPEFQGEGVVNANAFHIAAVISDVARHCEWRPKCKRARIVHRTGQQELIMYSQSPAPWPVSDRDVLLKASLFFESSKNQIRSTFKNVRHPKAPPIDGIVRVPWIRGFYKLKILGPYKTFVTYRVNADPGGLIPAWLAARTSRLLPLKTIMGLRRQVKRPNRQYHTFRKKWDPRQQPKSPVTASAKRPSGS